MDGWIGAMFRNIKIIHVAINAGIGLLQDQRKFSTTAYPSTNCFVTVLRYCFINTVTKCLHFENIKIMRCVWSLTL